MPQDLENIRRAGRLGALKRYQLYGNPGTAQGRRLGGLRSQERFRQDPETWRQRGLCLRKRIMKPQLSGSLAEFIGIMLGDGGIRSRWQATISFNGRDDRAHAAWICRLVQDLFSIAPAYSLGKQMSTANLVVSSVALVEFLVSCGVPRGHKIRNGVAIPAWILESPSYRNACVRGLMDTDGSVYAHRYRVNGVEYRYPKLCFSSASPPLMNDVSRILGDEGYRFRIRRDGLCLYLEGQHDVDRYFSEIGTHNPRYRQRYETFKASRGRTLFGEVPEMADRNRLLSD